MEMHNLGKNILFQICRELTRRGRCRSLEAEFVRDRFADIPGETIDESLRWLVQQGWLHKNDATTRVILTEEGRAAIGNMIPESLRKGCVKPMACHRPW
ncbi:MAG: hypothetical protein PVJ53_01090 [Desulfobacterales bacterium]|jgi:hypothetical protein